MNLRLLKKALLRLGLWCLIGILLLYAVFPFYYAVITSFKPSSSELPMACRNEGWLRTAA